MKPAFQTILFSLFICLIPAMVLAEDGSSATANSLLEDARSPGTIDQNTKLDAIQGEAVDESQARESNCDTARGKESDALSQALNGLSGDLHFMGGGICSRLNPIFTCVDYDGNQGGLCPPRCHAPDGGCGNCEQDSGGTCHCSY